MDTGADTAGVRREDGLPSQILAEANRSQHRREIENHGEASTTVFPDVGGGVGLGRERCPITNRHCGFLSPEFEQCAREREHRISISVLRLDIHRKVILAKWEPGLGARKACVPRAVPWHRRALSIPALADARHVDAKG